jgi:hypothetical protein
VRHHSLQRWRNVAGIRDFRAEMKTVTSLYVVSLAALLSTFLAGCGDEPKVAPQPMSVDDFRRELVGMPLCGKASTGDLAGKVICTVHLADGTAIAAGSGFLARGFWDTDGKRICRRDALAPPDRRRCVGYERLGNNRYRNSDGVEFCIGPCP